MTHFTNIFLQLLYNIEIDFFQTPFLGLHYVPVYFFRMPKDRKTFYANYNNNNNMLHGVCSTGSSIPWTLSKNHITCLRKGKTVILVLFVMSTVFSRNSEANANNTCTTGNYFLYTYFHLYKISRKIQGSI